jgi:DNA-binding NtrC family response regulator
MSLRKLLCVVLGEAPVTLHQDMQLADWDVYTATDRKAASRLLRENRFLVGLLFLNAVDTDSCNEIDNFLKLNGTLEWVVALPGGLLDSPPCREIILGHMFDFHTLPVDIPRLIQTVGHAYGRALLRGKSTANENRADVTLVGQSPGMRQLLRQIRKIANVDAPVLISGESGSGKELTAQAVHKYSVRSDSPFVPLNCGAIPATLIQSELFGHDKGAFTGADRIKHGLIYSADKGTLFLDEIGDLSLELQTNLLRFLQEKTIIRVGSTQTIQVDVRIIAASHVNLEEAVRKGKFREDLFYRLNVLPLRVPPLRERKEDIEPLAQCFFHKFSQERSPRLKGFSSLAIKAMESHDWPGNVRELMNRVRRALVMAEGRLISPGDLELERRTTPRSLEPLGDARNNAERSAICMSLQREGKNITHAARDLGVSRMTLYRLMEKYGIVV